MLEDDGCSFWFNSWRGIDLKTCCDVHDQAFAYGRSAADFVTANLDLFFCGVGQGAWEWAVLALIGVSSPVGAALFFFGSKKPRPGGPPARQN